MNFIIEIKAIQDYNSFHMKNLFDKINHDLQEAMKKKDVEKLGTLRMMKSKILYVNARGDLPDAELIKIITKYSKELKEAITEAQKVNRNDIAKKTESELKIVNEYLPKELSPEEIKASVKKVIEETGASSVRDMGSVMKEVLARHPGVDGKAVNQIVREFLK